MDQNTSEARIVYTVKEVMALLGMSMNGVYNAVTAGEIPAVKIGKKIVIPKARLNALLNGAAV
jgi:excisionase family DNA binding protein